MSHELYIQVLSAMFLFWNGARILTYLPTIGKLLAREADIRSHSLLSWGSWTLSNGTFALMLLEMSRGIPNGMFWMNLANTLMCVIVSLIILFRRFPRLHTGVSKVWGKIRRIEPAPRAVSGQSASLNLDAGSPVGAHPADNQAPVSTHTWFGRPAAWIAAAGVLAFGAVGAVTFDVRPDHGQSGFVQSQASTEQLPGIIEPTSPTQQVSLPAPATPAIAAPPVREIASARTDLTPPVASASSERRAAPSRGSAAPRPSTRARQARATAVASQDHGNWATHFLASVKQTLGITPSAPPKRPTPSSRRGVASSSGSARGSAVARAEIVRHAPSVSNDHGTPSSRNSAPPQLPAARSGHADDFVTQDRPHSSQSAVYAAPPTVVFGAMPVAYAQAPVAYGYGYAGDYRESRQWHDNGGHKGYKHPQQDENDD
ncbi:hypothetical protein [Paraburkholderia saeva]|uniref:Uncharacterized protein n=1 Tax=Paraburkholderia saeva TaxID=2777537 RepID=A0A9N8RYZ5_9BURK|nr:hypothetical protein [Paraburkholderia saeva]CAG4889398.1 hypothetical protein R70241_00735 [Paraburkholderia saeva]CAG4904292.1 hypothetical protein R52603_03187 [Paraburkholderia saeva]CAG4915264.1 hypothetical protein LMG31841_04459 [Paraburkholderia saeva]